MFRKSMMNNQFAGSVYPAGPLPELPRPMPTEREEAQPTDSGPSFGLVAALTSLKPPSAELRQKRTLLLDQAVTLEEEAGHFLAEVRAERRAALEEQHETVKAEGKKQETLYHRLEQQTGRALQEWQNLKGESDSFAMRASVARENNENGSRWRTRGELKAAREQIVKAEAEAREAVAKVLPAFGEYQRLNGELAEAQKRLEELRKKELQLSGELSGQRYQDPATGLWTRPSL